MALMDLSIVDAPARRLPEHGPRSVVVLGPEVLQAGLTSLLAPFEDRFRVCAVAERPVPDLVVFEPTLVARSILDTLPATCVRVAVLTRSNQGALHRARLGGADLVVSLEAGVAELVVALTRGAAEPSRDRAADLELPPSLLSHRECEVLDAIARGLTNADVAGELFVSTNTVKTYVRSTYRKIGVKSRSRAVLWALENGFG